MDTVKFDSKILSSSHINFLFGAGVNGTAFPQINKFSKTLELLKNLLEEPFQNFEEGVDKLKTDEDRKQVLDLFVEEFNDFSKSIDFAHKSIKHIEILFSYINRLIEESENRTKTTKQVNIYTLNYDMIVEKVLENLGYLCNSISSSNIKNHDKFFYMVGYNFLFNKFVPTYLVSKLHGDINNPILPGINKYNSMIMANRFEILFKMKEKLSRENSVLIVIGYSGNDEHINKILKDCISSGLTIYWFKFKKEDYVPENMVDSISIIENEEGIDTTLKCSNMVKELWAKSLEE